MTAALNEIHDRLKAGNQVEALDLLLVAWNAHRAKHLATVIQDLGALIDRSLAPLETKGVKRKVVEEMWFDIAARRRSADLPRLLKVLAWASAPLLKEWTHQLSGFKPDPRIAVPLEKAAERFSSSGAGVTRTAARRLVETLESNDSLSLTKEEKELASRIQKEIARQRKLPPLSEDVLFVASSRPASKGAVSSDKLLRMVLDAPSDMQARIVFGDLLSEAGDPRGELIALQAMENNENGLGGTATQRRQRQQRIAALIKEHGASWIRPLDSVVKGPRFELGFLSGCEEIKFRTKQQRAELLEHELWATVRVIDACKEDALLVNGSLRSLEHLHTSTDVLTMLATSKTPPKTLSSVDVNVPLWDDDFKKDFGAIANVGGLTNLKRLRLELNRGYSDSGWGSTADDFSWLFQSKLGDQLELLEIDSGYKAVRLEGFLARLDELKNLKTVVVESTPPYARGGLSAGSGAGGKGIAGAPCPVRWCITRDPRGRTSPLRCELEIGWPYYNGKLREIGSIFKANLRTFPKADLPVATIKYIGRTAKSSGDLSILMKDLTRLITPFFANVRSG